MRSLLIIVAICFAFFSTSPVIAADEQPEEVLKSHVSAVLDALSSPEMKNPAEKGKVIAKVEDIISSLFDFKEFSARSIGVEWNNFTPDQKERFTKAFTDMIFESYMSKLDDYNGETVDYLAAVYSSNGAKAEIKTVINFKDKPANVDYRMIKKNKWVIYDVIIEGVSMVQNYRSQFQDALQKEGIDNLISNIEKKVVELRSQSK